MPKHERVTCVLLRLTYEKAASLWHFLFMSFFRYQAGSFAMKHSPHLRVLVAAAFFTAPLISANGAQAAPSLPLPAPQNRTNAEPKTAPKAAPTPKAATKSVVETAVSNDEPYVAPQGTDVPLRRNATPKAAPQPAPVKVTPSATPDSTNSSTSAPAGPLPRVVPLPPQVEDAPARSGNATPKVKGASVGGVRIEGLSERAALRKLNRVLDPVLRAPISLSDGQQSWTLRRDQLGATVPLRTLIREARKARTDVPLRFAVDMDEATLALQGLLPRVNRVISNRVDAVIPVGGTVSRTSQRVTMAVGGSAMRVKQALEARPPRSSVALVVVLTPVSAEKPVAPDKPVESSTRSAKSPYKDAPYLLAAFSTPYDSSIAGRTTNLRLAARNVNGTLVKPGKVFSTNLAIGRRNAANGWKEAKMFMNGEIVNGIGSGICQCSSTVYNAALLAGLPIVERHPHTFRVSYAPASRDATIYWGSKDFRFRNNTPGPIYVRTFLKNDRFHVELYGVQPVTNEIEISSRVLSRKKGTRSEAFRIIKTSGGETKQEKLSTDYYRPHP